MQNRGGPGPNETRNMLIAIVLSIGIFVGFEMLYNGPARERALAEQRAQSAQQELQEAGDGVAETPDAQTETPTRQGPVDREQVLAASADARVVIETASVDGSISLQGARIDDLNLRGYRRTVEQTSPEVTVLAPMNSRFGHDAFFGWERQTGPDTATLADAFSTWTAEDGARLTPTTPVTLNFTSDNGLAIERTISIDENYMFTITDVVTNTTDAPIQVRPFGTVRRDGMPEDFVNNQIVHQGLIGVFGERQLRQVTYPNARNHARDRVRGRVGEGERIEEETATGGWFGLTDHYWLTAIVPDQGEQMSAYFDSRTEDGQTDFRAAYRGQWREAPAGGSITYTQRLFSGAKRVDLLRGYQEELNIPRFDDAVDWGNFWFLTRPFFALLHFLAQFAGNFGLGILLTTIVVKVILFPLVYQSFKAMAKMRGLQPKMKEIQERYAADKQRQQQEILRLYQTEKINPVSGCIPILLQIPVFFALYKTLTVTIEMRHAPFYGWINDLSARDPTSLFNLFDLLPFDPSSIPLIGAVLMIGAWPIMYGVSMWALQALSPPPADPIQAQIFRFLPILFTFMFAAFPAGLVIYWTWSNTLSILQQYVIMRRQGVETQLDVFIRKRFGTSAAE
ncbi:MAG: membrane protein insertase YidC [Alphaproteobacteria bacterium]|nr:MAG: membrane protein insertase YidC [Alphaproteobacteria bacterium]